MASLAFDIETIGEQYDDLDETTQKTLTRWIEKTSTSTEEYDTRLDDLKNELGFSPYTGEIVAIGVLDIEKDKGVVYYQDKKATHAEEEHQGAIMKQMNEKDMLQAFWDGVEKYDTFVSFNGRGFDVPFLNVRSAVHDIRPSKDLMSNRYVSSQRFGAKHIDLMDQLTYYGAVWKKPNLHLATRVFGIASPKEEGVSGDDVSALFREGKCLDIARYNVRDIRATSELYKKWKEFLQF